MTLAREPIPQITRQTTALNASVGALTAGLGRLVPALIGVSAVSAIFGGTLGGIVTHSGAVSNGLIRLQSVLEDLLEPVTFAIEDALIKFAEALPGIVASIQSTLAPLIAEVGAFWAAVSPFTGALGNVFQQGPTPMREQPTNRYMPEGYFGVAPAPPPEPSASLGEQVGNVFRFALRAPVDIPAGAARGILANQEAFRQDKPDWLPDITFADSWLRGVAGRR